MYSFTEENYLKAIYKLQERNEDAVNTNSIAASLETNPYDFQTFKTDILHNQFKIKKSFL